MARVALLSPSDGRPFVASDTDGFVRESQRRVAAALAAAGHEVVEAGAPLTSAEEARSEARRLAALRPDLAVFNYGVWAFPHFTLIAAGELPCPLVLLGNVDPRYPGMVGLLAAGGALDQIGRGHERLWGEPEGEVADRIGRIARAAAAVARLRGSTFGRIGGRPMGMYTAVADAADWIALFGVDVEEIDQWELVRRAETVEQSRVTAARRWLERHVAEVRYDGRQLTPELLERQIRSYHAMQELIAEHDLAFSGIKAQPELTTHFATMDVAEAFLNDPYDWEGEKEPHVCATEADMDGALTMQLLAGLAGTPVLFADVRHYDREHDLWDLCNSGQHATWFAARSDDPAENLRHVRLLPEDFYFPAGGAAVHHVAAPGRFTFARLTRLAGRYRLQVTRGEVVRPEDDLCAALVARSSPNWPHAFARLDASPEAMLGRFGANHVHAVPGDVLVELETAARLLDVDLDLLEGG